MKTMFWRVYPSYLVIILLLLGGFSFYTAQVVDRYFVDWVQDDLRARTALVESQLRGELLRDKLDYVRIIQISGDLSQRCGNRVTVMLANGRVIADSDSDPTKMENHLDRPEVQQAIKAADGFGFVSRFSKTVGMPMDYVARTIRDNTNLRAVVRLAVPLKHLTDMLNQVYGEMLLGGGLVALISALIGLGVSNRISRPLRELHRGIQMMSSGQLGQPLNVTGTREVDTLVQTINSMTWELEKQLREIQTQRNEQQAILSSMVEGVLAVDNNNRLIIMNRAAEKLLGVAFSECQGKPLEAVARNIDLHHLVEQVQDDPAGTVASEIWLRYADIDRYMQANGAALINDQGDQIGVLVVLNDITRLRRLENVRKDFVSNVSHELKTPITSIKGFVETLLAGASEDADDTQRFLEIIQRQADRLQAITEDLLVLSELEDQEGKSALSFERLEVRGLIDAAVDVCELQINRKAIQVHISCEQGLSIGANGHLLEQALLNLIDNAVKYSDSCGVIEVSAGKMDEREVMITVRDYGCGIEENHLPRLFERFYRVDKARSRELGGTGLGLSIVKHIVQVHHGRIIVDSQVGKGTAFTIFLPTGEK